MNKPYNIQNTNICNGIFHISFFKAHLPADNTSLKAVGVVSPRESLFPYSRSPRVVFPSLINSALKNENIGFICFARFFYFDVRFNA
jgi:hypothetical protein